MVPGTRYGRIMPRLRMAQQVQFAARAAQSCACRNAECDLPATQLPPLESLARRVNQEVELSDPSMFHMSFNVRLLILLISISNHYDVFCTVLVLPLRENGPFGKVRVPVRFLL